LHAVIILDLPPDLVISKRVLCAVEYRSLNIGWEKFSSITWPLLLPLLAPAIIIRAIFVFNQFYIFYVLNPPYPLMTFATASFFFLDEGGNFAASAAINIFTVLVLVVIVLIFNRWSKTSEGVSYA